VLGERHQFVGGQRRLHQDHGISGPNVVDFQLDAADLNVPHTRRLAATVARCSECTLIGPANVAQRQKPTLTCAFVGFNTCQSILELTLRPPQSAQLIGGSGLRQFLTSPGSNVSSSTQRSALIGRRVRAGVR